MVAGPVVAMTEAASVRVLVPLEEAGLKIADTPLGRPLAVKDTLPVKPLLGEIVTTVEPLAPWFIERAEGLADRAKSGALCTLSAPSPFCKAK